MYNTYDMKQGNQKDFSTKTVCVKLDVPKEDYSTLKETFKQFNYAVQYVIDEGWDKNGKKNYSKHELHKKTYNEVREKTDLVANLVQAARNRGAECIKRCVQDWSNGKKATKPEAGKFSSVVYDKRTVTVKERKCSISTVDGRKHYDYILGEYQKEHLDDPNYDWRSATLNYDQKSEEFYLNITIRKPIDYKNGDRVMGVDLGIKNLAVTSTGRFFSGDDFSWRKDGYFRTRRSLQRKGTRSARRTLRQMSERENRYSRDYLHCVAKQIVEEALENDCAYIALEELTGIREQVPNWFPRNKRKLHQWAFCELREYIKYKAYQHGIRVVKVDPRNTSRCCSKCGHVSESNRNGSDFKCESCDYKVNSDYNASKNIGLRAISLPEGKSPFGLSNGQLALKNHTLNPSSSTVSKTA